ncbi:hypothetical protein [Paenibacillus sp. CFBP 13594]|uniref:hypothetical protein n=1 Tax=Paenibacillus sp. CFBP 13594 TaxID=2774037 RepID=UPI001A7EBB18|nr:hypothetical protein [Paenibacillus sp. CFBP 13594]
MNKETFDMIMKFYELENTLYFKLEPKLGLEEATELFDPFMDYRDSLLKTGKYLELDKCVNRHGFLKSKYETLPSYIKLTVIYDYENGYSLCETTNGDIYLIPKDLIQWDDK